MHPKPKEDLTFTEWKKKNITSCTHSDKHICSKEDSQGNKHFYLQCKACGFSKYLVNNNLKYTRMNIQKLYNEHLHDDYLKHIDELWKAYQEQKKSGWFEWYTKYLETDAWKAKRLKVFERDRFLCQGCGDKAEQVHHTTYAHVGDELLFELLSVCKSCHERIHDKKL